MPILCEFDSRSIHRPNDPKPDTQGILNFPHPVVARPRIAHGLRELDVDRSTNICVKSTIQDFSRDSADCHITAWNGSAWDGCPLHSGIVDAFVLAPGDLDFLTGEHLRNLSVNPNDPPSVRINFERPFVTPPKVVVFFNLINLDKNHNWRLKTTATNIDANGFTLNIETWGDTILYAAQVGWIAYPEDRKYIFSASVNTGEVRSWNQPQLQQSKAITFNKVEFFKTPTVFVALNFLDIDFRANLRIKAYVDSISKTGLTWHIDSWYDTVLYAAGASIIAFN